MSKKDVEAMSGKTDERKQGDWKSRYEEKARRIQIIEALYLFLLVVLSFTLMLLNFNGALCNMFKILEESKLVFSRMFYCVICGLLGGCIFDIKWFYKSISHGYWNEDRIYWRFFTPIISLSFAFCLACIFEDNIIKLGSGFSASTIGFLAGYFSDEAVGKMAEVAKVLFNTNNSSDKDKEKNENT